MIILFFLSALLSEVVGSIAGFGSSTVLLPLSLLFYDFETSLVLVAIFHIFGNITRINFFRKRLKIKFLLSFGIPSVLFSLIGALLVGNFSQELLKGILGMFLAVYAVFFLVKGDLFLNPNLTNKIIGGSLSGFLTGLIGTGGALRGAFLTAFGLPKEQYIVTAAAIAIVVDMTRLPVYLSQGFLSKDFYWFIPILFVIALCGSFIGKKIVSRIPQKQFKKIVLLAIFFVGIKFIFDWL